MSIWFKPDVVLADLNLSAKGCLPGFLGITFTAIGDDWLTARMPVNERTHQPFGRLHGGASVVLAETVASTAGTLVLDQERETVVGLDINANHVRPARDGYVHATATPDMIGRKTQVWSIRIVDDQGRLVCTSRLTAMVIALDRA